MCAGVVTSNAKECEYRPAPASLDASPGGKYAPSAVKPTDVASRLDMESAGVVAECLPKADGLLEDALVNSKRASEPLTRHATLTDRETQILQSILAGMTNKQIARALCRSQRTVEYHRNRLMQKLRARSAAELVRLAIIAGIT